MDFIAPGDWPSSNPDLNPLNYKLWAVLEGMVCKKRHSNINSLMCSMVKAVENFPMDIRHSVTDEWP